MQTIAVIPARVRSKGIPLKNIREVAGKPLIGWVIEACLRGEQR
jgi:CMP-N-acetylneuraminic acid synthetase